MYISHNILNSGNISFWLHQNRRPNSSVCFFFVPLFTLSYTHLNFISLCESIATDCSPLYFLHSEFILRYIIWMRFWVNEKNSARVCLCLSRGPRCNHTPSFIRKRYTHGYLKKKWERKQKSGIFHIKVIIFPIYTAENISIWTK